MKIIHHEKGRDPLYKIWNSIDGYMIIYIYSDGGSIVFQDMIYPLKKGVLCLIGPNVLHYTMPEDVSQYDRSKIFISEETFEKLLGVMTNTSFYELFKGSSVVYANIPPELSREVEGVFEETKNIKSTEFFISSFLRLLIYIKKYIVKSIPVPDNFMGKVLDFVNNNYSKSITLDDVCKNVHISKYHLCRQFKKTMNMTLMEYILKTRIVAAKNMLINENVSINEISEKCGFSSVSYFCQVFKEKTSLSPAKYRIEKRS